MRKRTIRNNKKGSLLLPQLIVRKWSFTKPYTHIEIYMQTPIDGNRQVRKRGIIRDVKALAFNGLKAKFCGLDLGFDVHGFGLGL